MWAVSDRIIFVKWNGKQGETSNFVDKYIYLFRESEERAFGSEIEYYHFHLFPFIVSKKRKTFVIVFKPLLVRASNDELSPSRFRIVSWTFRIVLLNMGCRWFGVKIATVILKKFPEIFNENFDFELFDLSWFFMHVHDYTLELIFFPNLYYVLVARGILLCKRMNYVKYYELVVFFLIFKIFHSLIYDWKKKYIFFSNTNRGEL